MLVPEFRVLQRARRDPYLRVEASEQTTWLARSTTLGMGSASGRRGLCYGISRWYTRAAVKPPGLSPGVNG